MRWFLIPAVATTAIALAGPTPAEAQIVIGGSPTYYPRYTVPFTPYTRVVSPTVANVVPNFNGGLFDFGYDNFMRTLGWTGYGPYAGNFTPFDPRYYGFANPTNYSPWGSYRPFNVPTNWKQVVPQPGNFGLPNGSFKGFGKRR
ncbi:MAG TPA: hypothetical protein VKD90_06845 [Gemmataceae bacterium]|nr:hypothetical protein [Gemmataceae bacterium]